MLEIRSDDGKLYLKAKGDISKICTDLVIALKALYEKFDEDEQFAFKCFLEDLLPGMVCNVKEKDDCISIIAKSLFKRLGEE